MFENLHNAFPDKQEEEIRYIAKQFYRYFCDLILESIKSLTISPAQLKKRMRFNDISICKQYYDKRQSLIGMVGHFGNWELAVHRFAIENLHTLCVIYHPLKNKYFDRLAAHMRTRFGSKIYPKQTALRSMLQNQNQLTMTIFVADQSTCSPHAYRTNFLNQETLFLTGPAKIARKLNWPIIYISIRRIKRGFYRSNVEVLVPNPKTTVTNEISESYVRRLEQDIIAQPETWLWTHRRWKHSPRS